MKLQVKVGRLRCINPTDKICFLSVFTDFKKKMTEVKVCDAGGATVTMIDTGSIMLPSFFKQGHEIKQIFENVPTFNFREDDVMLCTFGKTGIFLYSDLI